jgi:hypothetical protein
MEENNIMEEEILFMMEKFQEDIITVWVTGNPESRFDYEKQGKVIYDYSVLDEIFHN